MMVAPFIIYDKFCIANATNILLQWLCTVYKIIPLNGRELHNEYSTF